MNNTKVPQKTRSESTGRLPACRLASCPEKNSSAKSLHRIYSKFPKHMSRACAWLLELIWPLRSLSSAPEFPLVVWQILDAKDGMSTSLEPLGKTPELMLWPVARISSLAMGLLRRENLCALQPRPQESQASSLFWSSWIVIQ